jgi:hypothetical protein
MLTQCSVLPLLEIFAFVPQIKVPGFPFPFLACDIDQIDQVRPTRVAFVLLVTITMLSSLAFKGNYWMERPDS